MPDSQDQLPSPPDLAALSDLLNSRHMARYKPDTKKYRVLRLLLLSGAEGTPGVLSDTDSGIAEDIGLHGNVEQLHTLLAEMKARTHLRAVMVNGVRRYEFSRRLLPAYRGDVREPEAWDVPTPVMTQEHTPIPLEMTPEEVRRGGNRKWDEQVTPAEKTAFSRYVAARRLRAEQEGWKFLPLSRDKWVEAYRLGTLESLDPVTFEMAENRKSKSYTEEGKSYTDVRPVTFASRDDESDDDVSFNREKENHHHHSDAQPKVTEAKVTEPKVTESEARNEEVLSYLMGEGLWPDAAGPASTWCSLEDAHIYVAWSQNDAAKSKARGKDDSDPMTLLRYKLENRLPIAPAMREGYHQTLKAKRCQEEAQKTAERDAETAERVLAAFGTMDESQQRALCLEVARQVWQGRNAEAWREFATLRRTNDKKRPKPALQAMLDRKIAEKIVSERGWTPLASEATLPAMWQMPPDWDGFS